MCVECKRLQSHVFEVEILNTSTNIVHHKRKGVGFCFVMVVFRGEVITVYTYGVRRIFHGRCDAAVLFVVDSHLAHCARIVRHFGFRNNVVLPFRLWVRTDSGGLPLYRVSFDGGNLQRQNTLRGLLRGT